MPAAGWGVGGQRTGSAASVNQLPKGRCQLREKQRPGRAGTARHTLQRGSRIPPTHHLETVMSDGIISASHQLILKSPPPATPGRGGSSVKPPSGLRAGCHAWE